MLMANLRENARSAGITILFGIIIVVFIFSFGPASNGCRSGAIKPGGDEAATVNGEVISRKKFEETYARQLMEIQRRSGGRESISREQADALGFGTRVLDQLIDQELLLQAAQKEGLRVSDDEVVDELNKVDAFKVDGVFSKLAYANVVERSLGMPTWQFEDQLRRDLLLQKKVASIQASVRVSDDEIAAQYKSDKEVYALSAVRFSLQAKKAAVEAPTEEAIQADAAEHASEVEARYSQSKDRYNQSKQVRARHILIKTANGVTPEQAVEKIKAIKARIVGGEDFAEVAKAESEDDGSKVQGGDLGKFGEGAMVAEFQAAAFALKEGELSDPVLTKFGAHLIKVEEVIPAKTISLAEATPEIARALYIDAKAKELATQDAEEALKAVREGKTLAELWPAEEPDENGEMPASALGKPRVETSGDFRLQGSFIPVIGISDELAADLPNMKIGPADKVYEAGGNIIAVVLDKHETADMAALTDEVKASYRERLASQRGDEALRSFLAAAKEKAKIRRDPSIGGVNLDAVMTKK